MAAPNFQLSEPVSVIYYNVQKQWLKTMVTLILFTDLGVDWALVVSSHSGSHEFVVRQWLGLKLSRRLHHPRQIPYSEDKQLGLGLAGDPQA